MNQEIIFITSHTLKAQKLSRYLDHPVKHFKADINEIQSLDPIEVVTHKATEAYKLIEKSDLLLVEDISITFEALGKLPGTLIKWFLEELRPYGLCKLLDGYKNKNAYVEPYFALYDGKSTKIFTAKIKGTISDKPKGNDGFGIDSIFIPDGFSKTWGEMDDSEKDESSVRKVALNKLSTYLKNV